MEKKALVLRSTRMNEGVETEEVTEPEKMVETYGKQLTRRAGKTGASLLHMVGGSSRNWWQCTTR